MLAGGTLHLASRDTLLTEAHLLHLLRTQKISFAILPPSLLNLISADNLPDLRVLVSAGEACPPAVAAKWAPGRRFFNGYGPTEATVGPLIQEVKRAQGERREVLIGRPINNMRVYLLDQEQRPVPIGVTGEIYIGGPGLARGYIGRQDLNTAHFVPHPFAQTPGERLYKTGDLARYNHSGALKFVGRVDNQIQLRGHRVEPDDIAQVLNRHPEIKHAVVTIAQVGAQAAPTLIAYYLTTQGAALLTERLRSYLEQRLPAYMVPARYQHMARFPLNSSGKIDYAQLPPPDPLQMGHNYRPPRNATEAAICTIWADLFDIERVGIEDDFFELGGHSLLATQAVSRMRAVLKRSIEIKTLFENRTIAQLIDTLIKLDQTEDLILETIPEISRQISDHPLSYAQQRLWFLDQLEPGSTTYNMAGVLQIVGDLDIEALEKSMNQLIARHEILRTVFIDQNGVPTQRILPFTKHRLEIVDLSHQNEVERQNAAFQVQAEEATTPFDLSQGPLIRYSLLKLSSTRFVLLLTIHHIISDEWSSRLMLAEIETRYNRLTKGEEPALPQLERQYIDFTHWQKDWLRGEVIEKQLAYWLETLNGYPQFLELPTDHPRPAVSSGRGAEITFKLPIDLAKALDEFCQQNGVTPFMTLLAAYYTLLYRYSGQERILVGSPIANRHRLDTESMLGFFANTLVLPAEFSENISFFTLLAQIRATTLAAYQHQDLPFEMLVDALQPERDMSYTPLFQVMFALEEGMLDISLDDTKVDIIDQPSGTSKFDLTLTMQRRQEGLSGQLEFSTDLFEAETIERFATHFVQILSEVVADPQRAVDHLPLLDEASRQMLVVEWNRTQHEVEQANQPVHHLFEAQVEQTPDATAVVYRGESLSYRELNLRANRLAHLLSDRGVRPERAVGIALNRSLDLLTAVLGILKAGGAYLPLDPTHPTERLQHIVAESGVEIVITETDLAQEPAFASLETVVLDQADTLFADFPSHNPHTTVSPEHLAYIIYTSGSTGRPKGVMVEHRNLSNALVAWDAAFDLTSLSAHLQMANFAFDVFTADWVRALCRGATLVLCPRDWLLEPQKLYGLIDSEKIDSAEFVPAVLRLLMQYVAQEGKRLKHLKILSCGSDSWNMGEYKRFLTYCGPETRLINSYGVTEATIDSAYYEIDDPASLEMAGKRMVPIGTPFANIRLYILDPNREPTPIGVPGELYIGGRGVARGYLKRPELSAERFIDDPFHTDRSGYPARLFKTGDQARYLADGNIELMGRLDDQIKIRGFRIEPGEIEATIEQHRAVIESVVVGRSTEGGERRLVAYAVLEEGMALTPDELHRFIRERLPDYMVPSATLFLPQLPLTPNGKIDRQALPQPTFDLDVDVDAKPRNQLEARLAKIWADLLNRPEIGIHHNFFELGGHSLLATQVVSRIEAETGVRIPLRALFDTPTIAGLTPSIATAAQTTGEATIPPLTTIQRDQLLPLSFSQERLWFLDRLEPDSPLYNLPGAFRLTGRLDVHALTQSFNKLSERHEILRTVFVDQNGVPRQKILPYAPRSIEEIDLSHLSEPIRTDEANNIQRAEAKRPFSLENGPLIRYRLIKLADSEFILMLTMHHIISDEWSINLMIEEVQTCYAQYAHGKEPVLPAPQHQYSDYAHWQRAWLQGEVLETQVAYWKNKLDGYPPLLQLPTDHPRPAVMTTKGNYHPFELPTTLAETLNRFSQQHGVSLFMTLLAAYQTLLYRYSGQDRVKVGTPIANRHRLDTESMLGFFVNTLVLPADFSESHSFRTLLAQIRETTLSAYKHQDLPFELLVEALQPTRDLSYSPLFQAMFLLEEIEPSVNLDGIFADPVEQQTGSAKFDLSLTFTRKQQGLLSGRLEYNTDLFEPETAEQLVNHLLHILAFVCEAPDTALAEIPLLRTTEKERLLVDWNRTAEPAFRNNIDLILPMQFGAQAMATPDRQGITDGKTTLTYRQLDQRANQIARHLLDQGLHREELVAVYLPRTVDMVAALLGILKAGGAYLPLDQAFPAERLAYMISDSGANTMISSTDYAAEAPWMEEIGSTKSMRLILLDRDRATIDAAPRSQPPVAHQPTDLAYVIYTSGSTGQPKGVAIEHAQLANFLAAMRERPGIGAEDTLLAVTTISFDISVLELFLPLTVGGAVAIVERDVASDGVHLARALDRFKATLMQATPATWSLLLNSGWHPSASFTTALCGGEALPRTLAAQLLEQQLALWNMYGPTETTIWSCVEQVREVQKRPVSIGRPIANTEIYIVDDAFQPVPIGVPGHLYIGGAGVARGYLNRPELTAERFISASISEKNDQTRLYKTGDIARYLRDGRIEYLGRSDFQVKIRGYRIEPGEIAHVLSRHPQIKDAIVGTQQRTSGEERFLVAYYRTAEGSMPTHDQLSAFLKQHLPAYMVPTAYLHLESYPQNTSGKIDYKRLPRPELEVVLNLDNQPRNEIEKMLADIWSDVLDLPEIGIHQNFFELGGHSLLATQIVSRISQKTKIELQLRQLFETPTIAGLSLYLAEALRGEVRTPPPPLTHVDRTNLLPLSFAQERMWFFNRLLDDDSAYHIMGSLKLEGEIDFEAVSRAWNKMVERHEDLRTLFPVVDGIPYQQIIPPYEIWAEPFDLRESHPNEASRMNFAMSFIREDFALKFNLENGPPYRIVVFIISDNTYLLYFLFHHIIFDQWSAGVLWRDFLAYYENLTLGKPVNLPEMPFQYADFALWQRNWLQGEQLEKELSFWKSRLEGITPLELPTDRPRPPLKTYVGSLAQLVVHEELLSGLHKVAQSENVTLFMLMLAVFKLLLMRYTGREDIAIGVPVANRHRIEVEPMLGTFVNLLVMRSDLSGNPTFADLLERVRDVALDTYAHQEMPFEKLVEELVTQRDPAHTPLVQVLFNMINAPFDNQQTPGVETGIIDFDRQAAQYDLNITVDVEEDEMIIPRIGIEYNTDLFDHETIERMLGHYEMLLTQVVDNVGRPIDEYELLTPAEKEVLLNDWNATEEDLPLERCVHHLIEDQVVRTPDAIAATFEGRSISYATLNRRANQLAHHLRQQGVGPGDLIGLSTHRSLDMLVGLLGIWKAGCAYLPIDPTYPEDRIAYILDDAAAPLVVTEGALANKWELVGYRGTLVNIDTDWGAIAQQPDSNPVVPDLNSNHLAYIIHTSGSTGRPKGVEIHHFNAVNFLLSMAEKPGLDQNDTLLAVTTISFDIAVLELYLPLLVGGRVVIASKENSINGKWLLDTLESERVTAMQATPATWKLMLGIGWEGTPGLKIMCGGEELPRPLAEALLPRGAELWNMYGPTETTVWSAVKKISSGEGPVPIGDPIANTEIYILDKNLMPTPIGVPGELCIGGEGVARGYLNRPELTAEKFVDDPFRPGKKLYKVGDLARYRPDGTIEFLGRLDFQVKVRGYRIELGEIETVLRQHPAVHEGVVVARDDAGGNKRLVGYLIPTDPDQVPNTAALRDYIGASLPNYMVPTLFAQIDSWPLTPNGKIDRKNLPEPDQSDLGESEIFIAPRNEREAGLAELWEETLALSPIGMSMTTFLISVAIH